MKKVISILIIVAIGISFYFYFGSLNQKFGRATAREKITVLLAASLISPLKEIKQSFQKDYPFIEVDLLSDSSSALRRKIEILGDNNDQYDIFLSASYRHGEALKEKGFVEKGYFKPFLQNSLVVISHSREKLISLSQLKRYKSLAIGDYKSRVPCGVYAYKLLVSAGIWDVIKDKVTLENTVKTVLFKVKTRAVEGGIVYKTDLFNQGGVFKVFTPKEALYPQILYPKMILRGRLREGTKAFYFYLESDKIKEIFKKYGFKVVE